MPGCIPDGEYSLGASAANDAWIKAARQKKQGKLEELKMMEETSMVKVSIIKEEEDDESKKPKDTK